MTWGLVVLICLKSSSSLFRKNSKSLSRPFNSLCDLFLFFFSKLTSYYFCSFVIKSANIGILFYAPIQDGPFIVTSCSSFQGCTFPELGMAHSFLSLKTRITSPLQSSSLAAHSNVAHQTLSAHCFIFSMRRILDISLFESAHYVPPSVRMKAL